MMQAHCLRKFTNVSYSPVAIRSMCECSSLDRSLDYSMRMLIAMLVALCAGSTVHAQWPPVPPPPGPIMEHVHLPGNRFVPSTKRWNLVWADQLIPNNISAAQLKFAAEHYVATQKIWANQVAQFRAINPNFLCVAYHLAAGLNPAHNDDCPDPKSQTGSGFIGSIAPKG